MGELRDILDKPEPERTLELQEVDPVETYGVNSPKEIKVKFQGKVRKVKKGYHQYPAHFAIWLLNRYDGTVKGRPVLSDDEPPKKADSKGKK